MRRERPRRWNALAEVPLPLWRVVGRVTDLVVIARCFPVQLLSLRAHPQFLRQCVWLLSFPCCLPCSIESRDSILQWTCIAHNAVNARQHKRAYPCGDIKALDVRWGDCGCDRGPGAAKA